MCSIGDRKAVAQRMVETGPGGTDRLDHALGKHMSDATSLYLIPAS